MTQSSGAPVFSLPTPFAEPTQRRIRVRLADQVVADSTHALLLVRYGPEGLPTYYLPRADVDLDALVDEQAGERGTSTWTVQAGSVRAETAAWTHPHPAGALADLAGHVTFCWRQLHWYEEDERVVKHARDPHKRVDTLRSSRRVQVLVDGVQIAHSVRPLLLFETGMPTRFYLPFEDLRGDLLEPSDTVSICPYKGKARYWSLRVGDRLVPDAVWSYPDPIPDNPKIRDLACFYNERVDLVVDGEALSRPVTSWSDSDEPTEADAEA